MVLDLNNYRVVDISARVVADVVRINGVHDKGIPDPLGERCQLTEKIGGRGTDGTMSTRAYMSGHVGTHTEGAKGHISHWKGFKNKGHGLWEYPLSYFYGEAVVIDLSNLKPGKKRDLFGGVSFFKSYKGQAITPDYLKDVKKGDIVLLWSCYKNWKDMPYIPVETAKWLLNKKIKMIGIQMPGVLFDTPECTTHNILLANDVPITYPLANLDKLKRKRVFYLGLPINIHDMESTWVRTIAIEEV